MTVPSWLKDFIGDGVWESIFDAVGWIFAQIINLLPNIQLTGTAYEKVSEVLQWISIYDFIVPFNTLITIILLTFLFESIIFMVRIILFFIGLVRG